MGNSLKTKVLVVPYINEIPNNNKLEEKAEDMISLKAASEDCLFVKSKLAAAANGMVDISSPR